MLCYAVQQFKTGFEVYFFSFCQFLSWYIRSLPFLCHPPDGKLGLSTLNTGQFFLIEFQFWPDWKRTNTYFLGARIETVAIDGDMNLGGRDCDEALMEFCLKEYIKEYKEENDNNDPKITARIKEKFKQAARELKIDLSSD